MDAWKRDYLKEEYFKLQDQYEDYDRRALQIKGWVGAGAIAAIAIGFDSEKSGSGMIWLVISLFSCCFWYLEAKWKVFQYAISDRIRLIEAHFRGEENALTKVSEPLQIYNWWYKSYRYDNPIYKYENDYRPKPLKSRIKAAAFQDFVMLPYLLIILICLGLLAHDLLLRVF
ncbi:MAG: hypothetical protein CL693_01360 [Cellvibrionaceae bacterium]|nr:hypothetical protein [Cellvibrionaceae bacterium]|tara:strand:- start:1800 stop:2315 length:516 start_codon:yes stop_codon:yes gene_type:complete